MKSRPFSYPKAARLRLKTDFDELFLKGKTIREFPLKAVYLGGKRESGDKNPYTALQTGLVVPKKLFKRAVDRNRIKRLMREAIRLHSVALRQILSEAGKKMRLVILFTGKEEPDFATLQTKIILILQRLQREHEVAAHQGHAGDDRSL